MNYRKVKKTKSKTEKSKKKPFIPVTFDDKARLKGRTKFASVVVDLNPYIKKEKKMVDQNVYDTLPAKYLKPERYRKGYAITIFLSGKDVDNLSIRSYLKMFNVYAFVLNRVILTDKNKMVAIGIIIFKTKWERDTLIQMNEHLPLLPISLKYNTIHTTKHRVAFNMVSGVNNHDLVYFHKAWRNRNYNPYKYATIKNISYWEKQFDMPEDLRLARRKTIIQKAGCFAPMPENKDRCEGKHCYFKNYSCPFYYDYEQARAKQNAYMREYRNRE